MEYSEGVSSSASLLPRAERGFVSPEQDEGPRSATCWKQYSQDEDPNQQCRECLSYRSQARRCHEMRGVPEEFGSLRLYCQSACEDCEFYQLTRDPQRSVLVVSRKAGWLADLAAQATGMELNLQLAASVYECGAAIEKFRPDFIVVDRSFGTHRTQDICRHLNDDDRIPITRIILTSRQARWPEECEHDIYGWIEKPFPLDQLDKFIAALGSERQPSNSVI